jgi:hypothetical protein
MIGKVIKGKYNGWGLSWRSGVEIKSMKRLSSTSRSRYDVKNKVAYSVFNLICAARANGTQRCQQLFRWVPLADEAVGPGGQGCPARFQLSAEGDDLQSGAKPAEGGQPIISPETGQLPIQQHQIGLGRLHLGQQVLSLGRLAHHTQPWLLFQQQPQRRAHLRLVIS